MKPNGYYWKSSKVSGQLYMQIWKRENGKDEYVLSVGSAEKCYKKLVKQENQKEQTKQIPENLTKPHFTNLIHQTKNTE